MPGRFEEVTPSVIRLMERIRDGNFPELIGAKIRILFDTKKRTSGGKIVIGRIQKTNDLLRHFTEDEEAEDGCDYIMYLDQMIFNNIEEEDQIRIIRHELRHTLVDLDSNSNPYKIRGHSIEDFYSEIELNQDDPRWAQRVAELGSHLYEQERDATR